MRSFKSLLGGQRIYSMIPIQGPSQGKKNRGGGGVQITNFAYVMGVVLVQLSEVNAVLH